MVYIGYKRTGETYKVSKKVIFISLSVFIVLSIGFFLLTVAIEKEANTERTKLIVEDEAMLVQTQSNILSYEVSRFLRDLEFAAQVFSNYNSGMGGYNTVADIWKSFSDKEMMYDQIRYIDADGYERIRINYSADGSKIVEQQDLQNKKDRYYFTETIKLEEGQIYISKLDLNIENGEIEQPIKPMIRIATPIFSDNGEKKGIIIVNYYAKNLIDNFDNIASASDNPVFLLNEDGYWLSNSADESKEWAFMYEDKLDIRFDGFYPSEWGQVTDGNESGIINSENGIFIYDNVLLSGVDNSSIVAGEDKWLVLLYISPDAAYSQGIITSFWSSAVNILREEPMTYTAILIISAMSTLIIALRYRMDKRRRFFSDYDNMTKVYNRRAGLRHLSKIFKEARRRDFDLSVCFVDVNGLKEVNDVLGHEKGDELLKTVVDYINSSIRNTDLVARLGGDEFLIVLPDSNKEIAETIWQRVTESINEENSKGNREYVISASHGIRQFVFEEGENIDEVIKAADALMYKEKSEIKKGLRIIKNK